MTGIWLHNFFKVPSFMHEESPQRYLTLTETESRLSLGMTSDKTYHFQTTANHNRFIKVWTYIADLPTSNFFVQTFFLEKVWLRNTVPTYDLDVCPNFQSFFFWSLSLDRIYFLTYNNTSAFRNYVKQRFNILVCL